MSKKKATQPSANPKIKESIITKPEVAAKPFQILRYPLFWLGLISFFLYVPTFSFQFTDLDDTIFIRNFSAYNEDLHNLVVSFQRGVFDVLKDTYYRPLFLDSIILNYHFSGQDIMSYHVVNVVLHVIAVLLLYTLFIKLDVKRAHAFILSLIFAVHPVLSQAVAWIPGRNDTMLAIFTLSFFIFSIEYANAGKIRSLIFAALFLLLAFFTKETAVFAAPVAFILLVVVLQKKWLDRNNLIQYAIWTGCFIFWFIIRANAIVAKSEIMPGKVVTDFINHLPRIVQYIGKIFLPFNLSVFPIQEDTVYYYGVVAIVLLTMLLVLNKKRNARMIAGGIAMFFLFLLPVLIVPDNLNEQAFEHRLYLPLIGILLLLPQTILFQDKPGSKKIWIGAAVVTVLFTLLNLRHQQNFKEPYTFWSSAVETSPHSAYANMMLGAREDNLAESSMLFRKAYQLNPKEKYLNFYYGVMLQKQDSVPQSEKYLLAEKNSSGYYECDYYLARVAAEQKDLNRAITYLETDLKNDPGNKTAYNNLLILYVQTQQKEKAIGEVKIMKQRGIEVPPQLAAQLRL